MERKGEDGNGNERRQLNEGNVLEREERKDGEGREREREGRIYPLNELSV